MFPEYSNTIFIVFLTCTTISILKKTDMNTKQQHSEIESLRKRIDNLENVLEHIPASVYINQIETIGDMQSGRNIFINKYGRDIVGYSQEEITAMGPAFFEKILHPDDSVIAEESIKHLHSDGVEPKSPIYRSVSRIRNHAGNYHWCIGHTSVFKTRHDGTPLQFINVSLDISEFQHTILQLDDAMKVLCRLKNRLLLELLSKREKEILSMIVKGMTDDEIGRKLFISTQTAHTHRHRILKKTNSANTAALVSFAVKCGF